MRHMNSINLIQTATYDMFTHYTIQVTLHESKARAGLEGENLAQKLDRKIHETGA